MFDPRDCNVLGVLRSLIGTVTPCGTFKAAGGKLIMWQGLADQLIFTGDSINYYNHALAANGGIRDTESFFRYFLAPGVMHCGTPGPGSIAPTNPMQQVIDWVEQGQAPAVLNASGSINGQAVTRPLCPYPDPEAIYTGGDPDVAASYTCSSRPQSATARARQRVPARSPPCSASPPRRARRLPRATSRSCSAPPPPCRTSAPPPSRRHRRWLLPPPAPKAARSPPRTAFPA